VARLHSDPQFHQRIAAQFEGDFRLHYHLAPPWLAQRDPRTGAPRKRQFGPWMGVAFRLLAKLKFLRATAFDPFGLTLDRRSERALIVDYEATLEEILARLDARNHAAAVELAALPEHIRGFGHVKAASLEGVRERQLKLLERLHGQASARVIPIHPRAA
jgi:indolepyruvate ferredoxin oxidoreductase